MNNEPGSTSRSRSFCGVDRRIIVASTAVVSTTVSAAAIHLTPPPRSVPKMSRLPPRLDSTATKSRATPASTSQARPRSLLTTGLRRLLRGIAQTTLMALCAAWPSPMMPYSAASEPTITAEALPWMPSGRPSWSPTIGNCASAEVRMSCWRCGCPCSTNPSTDDAISRIGKIATKA